MKLYNPWKPHGVQFTNELYAVRKLTVLGWQYLDNNINQCSFWWSCPVHTLKYATQFTLDQAQALLDSLNKNQTLKTRKVIH